MITEENKTSKTCVVMFHDLLGFGNMVSSSCGTLDSAVGEIAYDRISNLANSVKHVDPTFPTGTHVIHFNDSVIASIDLDITIGSQLIDPSGIASQPINVDELTKALNFLGASARLHQKTLASEEENKFGPGGRTVIAVGKRWLVTDESSSVLNQFQANLAFAEAYLAESIGSKGGLNKRCFYNLYVNDYMWHIMSLVRFHSPAIADELDKYGMRDVKFPECMRPTDDKNNVLEIEIFHRKRKYYSLMSHHTCDINIKT